MNTADVYMWERGERVRPLDKGEMRQKLEALLAQWVDAHPGGDSGTPAAQGMLQDLGEEIEMRLDDLLTAGGVEVPMPVPSAPEPPDLG